MSNPASSFQQGYVSTSRGKKVVKLFTDDKQGLVKLYQKENTRQFVKGFGK